MRQDETLTLAKVLQANKSEERSFRPADFLDEDEQKELQRSNAEGAQIKRPFDEIDAFSAEILARFGYDTYKDWQNGAISMEKMARYIAAERARTARERYNMEAMLLCAISGANNAGKSGKAPKTLRTAHNILKEELKIAKGAQ